RDAVPRRPRRLARRAAARDARTRRAGRARARRGAAALARAAGAAGRRPTGAARGPPAIAHPAGPRRPAMTRPPVVLLRLAALALAATALARPLPPQAPATQDPKPAEKPAPDWPPLSSENAARVKSLVSRLDDPELADAAEAELVALGPAAAPPLIAQLGRRRPTAPETLLRILERIVTPEYAARVAEKAKSKAVAVRQWAVGTLALLHDPRWKDLLTKASGDEDPLV